MAASLGWVIAKAGAWCSIQTCGSVWVVGGGVGVYTLHSAYLALCMFAGIERQLLLVANAKDLKPDAKVFKAFRWRGARR